MHGTPITIISLRERFLWLAIVLLISLPGVWLAPAQASFGFRKAITIDRTQVGVTGTSQTTLTDFPLLFSVTDDDLKTTANGGQVTDADGDDIVFRALDDDTCGGPATSPCALDHELESYTASTGELVAWVRLPSVNTNAASTDTVLYIYYGDSSITSPSENPSGVWDAGFAGVWHLEETVTDETTSGTHDDSSANNNDGTQSNNNDIAGKIARAQDFDGNDYINIPDSGSLDITGELTIEAWINLDVGQTSQDAWARVASKWFGSLGGYALMFKGNAAPTNAAIQIATADGASQDVRNATFTFNPGTWYHVAAVWEPNPGIEAVYINGSAVGGIGSSSNSAIQAISADLQLGGTDACTCYLDGQIDEVRISNTVRDADWIKTEYNNQNNPGDIGAPGFYTVGTAEPGPPTAVNMRRFTALAYGGGVFLRWHTRWEADNLGWHVYREVDGEPVKLTPGMLAGSVFMFGQGTRLTSGFSYSWWDPAGHVTDRYWIEDIALNRTHTMHGPIIPQEAEKKPLSISCSPLLSRLGRTTSYQDLITCLRPKPVK